MCQMNKVAINSTKKHLLGVWGCMIIPIRVQLMGAVGWYLNGPRVGNMHVSQKLDNIVAMSFYLY